MVPSHGDILDEQPSWRARTWYRRLETCQMNNQAVGLEHGTVAWSRRARTWYRHPETCKMNNQAGGLEHASVAWRHVR